MHLTNDASWLVVTDADRQGELGVRLAQGVPGEWYEHHLGRWIGYRKRCEARRSVEAARMAQALAFYLCRDYWPRVLARTAGLDPGGLRDQSSALSHSARLLEGLYAYLSRHSRVVVPSLVHVWLPAAAGAVDERVLWAEWCEGPVTARAVEHERAIQQRLARPGGSAPGGPACLPAPAAPGP